MPTEELRTKRVSLLLTSAERKDWQLMELAKATLNQSNSLSKTVGTLARILKCYITKSRDSILDPVTQAERKFATHVLFAASMGPTHEAMEKSGLSSLRPFKGGQVYFTRGRVGTALASLLGCNQLPILMPSTRLAEIIMWHCHSEDHRRNPRDTLARSREYAWIVRGSRLAQTICAKCSRCRLLQRTTQKQVMAEIPTRQLVPCPPFTNISVDFMGPFSAKGLANQRARIKVYGLIIVCQNTRAVKVVAVPGYDTGSFLIAFNKFTSNHGMPEFVTSDKGSQLVKAGKILNVEKGDWDELDWKRILEATAKSGVRWCFVEAGCQWRNGLVERQVASLKHTLKNVLDLSVNLNFAELDMVFSQAANIVNQRPLAVQTFKEGDERFITPNDLLLGRNRVPFQPGHLHGDNDNDPLRLQLLSDILELWWDQWLKQVFPALLPYQKWRTEHRNISVGDVVLVLYASKVQKADFCLARVSEVHPDPHGTVRTITVVMRPRDSREKVSRDPPYLQPKPPTHLRVGVQRVVVILPVEEQKMQLQTQPAA